MPGDPLEEDFSGINAELVAHPHDAYFKRVFSDPALAAELFRRHLPAEVADRLQWDQLQLMPGSYVKRSLQQSHSDLLFRVPRAGGEEVLVYLLFEHQTSVDPMMPLRLLSYITELWLSQPHKKGASLPPVIPFVLHQGPEAWTVPQEFVQMVHLPPGPESAALRPCQPDFRYHLLDLTRRDPAREEPDHALRMVLHLMKLARQRQRMMDFFEWLGQEIQLASEALLSLSLLYALHAAENLDVEKIELKLESNRRLKEKAMSLAQYLMQRGRSEGLMEGRTEGLMEGLEKGEVIGGIRSLQVMLGRSVTPREEMLKLGLPALRQLAERLEHEFRASRS